MPMGETAPNAVLEEAGGTRPQRGFIEGLGEPAPNAVLEEATERLLRGYWEAMGGRPLNSLF